MNEPAEEAAEPISFRDFTRRERCTYDEADALASYLAQMRARALYERIRPDPRWSRRAVVG